LVGEVFLISWLIGPTNGLVKMTNGFG